MDSYTYCSEEGVEAVVRAMPGHYPMDLNMTDSQMLVKALWAAWESDNGEISEWAGDFLSSIAQTVEIEFV